MTDEPRHPSGQRSTGPAVADPSARPTDEPTTVAWFHCFSGIAGDMTLGALLDAGADLDEVRSMCSRLPVSGWALEAEPVMRTGIGGTKVHVVAEPSTVVRTAGHIVGLVEEARLPDRVRTRALATFRGLAVAEGHLHRRPPDQVHFHEVGGIDAIIDVVGSCAALEVLGIDELSFSPVANGIGMVRTAHGLMPNPVPAVMELLRGVPTYALDVSVELTTPTGAALASALASSWGPLPDMVVRDVGFGAGSADLGDRPNLLQVVVGERAEVLQRGQPVVLAEVNVDDATGETLAHTIAALLVAGAHDAWLTPIVMKKGRPAYTVSALVDPSLASTVIGVLTAETGSLGVRAQTFERWPQARSARHVEVDGLAVRVKVGRGRVKVEHDDAVAVARRTGRPLREVVFLAEQAWGDSGGGGRGAQRSGMVDSGPNAVPIDELARQRHSHDHDLDHDETTHDPGSGASIRPDHDHEHSHDGGDVPGKVPDDGFDDDAG